MGGPPSKYEGKSEGKKAMTTKKFKLQEVHNFIKQYSEEIFAKKIAENNYISFVKEAVDKNTDELLNLLHDKDFEESLKAYGMDEFSPISEYLYHLSIENDSLKNNDEYLYLVNNQKPIWYLDPEKVAFLFKNIQVSFDEIKRRIKNEFIFEGSLGTVMARADKHSANEDLSHASLDFAIKKEEHKREMFLNQLQDYYLN